MNNIEKKINRGKKINKDAAYFRRRKAAKDKKRKKIMERIIGIPCLIIISMITAKCFAIGLDKEFEYQDRYIQDFLNEQEKARIEKGIYPEIQKDSKNLTDKEVLQLQIEESIKETYAK